MSQNKPLTREQFDIEGDIKIAIVATRWNSHITVQGLMQGALARLDETEYGSKAADRFMVPGAVELTNAAARLIDTGRYDAIVVLGCVIKGDTPHFDYVCQSVTQGVTELNAKGQTPVIFGVLTVLDEQQALDRAGGRLGNKGAEAVDAALEMIELHQKIELIDGGAV